MEICIIGPCLKMGGMERASVNLANTLSRKGFEVTYLSIFNSKKFFQLDNNVNFIEPTNFNINSLSIFKTIFYIRDFAKSSSINTYIVFNKLYSALAVLGLFSLRKKTFISERSSPLYKWPYLQEMFIRLVFTFLKPTGIIAQTMIAANIQSKYYGRSIPILVMPNVVTPVESKEFINKKKIILAVGRLDDYLKGFDRLVEAFQYVNDKSWKLVFVGKNNTGDFLADLVKKFNLIDRVQFEDASENIFDWYNMASIFVIPSRSEGFPNALAEAMVAGLPCISYDFVAGPSDLIENRLNGIIVKEGDIVGLANSINELIEDKALRKSLGLNAKKIISKLNEDVITSQLSNFIVNV